MPTARNDAPRLRAGTVASASITSTYAITNWTVQSDQQQGSVTVVEWLGPYQMIPAIPARIAIAMDGTARADGFYRGTLGPFSYWTMGMVGYYHSTYLGTGVYSAAGSLMVFDETDAALYLNATIYRLIPGQDMEPYAGGWKNVRIRYDFGAVAA